MGCCMGVAGALRGMLQVVLRRMQRGQAGRQASWPAGRQAGWQAGKQAGKQASFLVDMFFVFLYLNCFLCR